MIRILGNTTILITGKTYLFENFEIQTAPCCDAVFIHFLHV